MTLTSLGFTKTALITGQKFDTSYLAGRVPLEDAVQEYLDYSNIKSIEPKTPWRRALLTGGGLGAGIGAIAGRLAGRTRLLAGAAMGGTLGTLIGTSLKLTDDEAIEKAQQILISPNITSAAKREVVHKLMAKEKLEPFIDEIGRMEVRRLYEK